MPDDQTDPTPAITNAPTAPPEAPPSAAPTNPAVDPPLGEAGKRAIKAEREAAAEARRELDAAKAELEALRTSQMSDQDKALKAARAEGAAEVSAKFATQVLHSEIRAAAAMKLADPSDAVRLLDLSKFKVTDGSVDTKAIASAIDELVTAKPYLAASKQAAPAADLGQGARTGSTAAQIRDRGALKNMTPEQIDAAHRAGQFDEMLRG